jgi:hypothetical protein
VGVDRKLILLNFSGEPQRHELFWTGVIPDYYQEITAGSPAEVQEWFNEMRDDEQAEEEGNLKEIYGLYDAALRRLRELGFRRDQHA